VSFRVGWPDVWVPDEHCSYNDSRDRCAAREEKPFVYGVSVTYVSAIVAGVLTAAALAAWPWARTRRRFVVAGITTLVSWIAWHLLLDATGAFGFDVDAPIISVSWEDVGSGVVALFATVVVLGLGTERREPAIRVVGAAAIVGLVAMVLDVFV
jgi:hypothetical protein